MDEVEELARERAKKLFGCTYVNVQPHSGAQANMAVQFAILKPGDTSHGNESCTTADTSHMVHRSTSQAHISM